MANLTYRGALAQNELVASGAGANQENIDGTQVVGATGHSAGGFKDSGWNFNSLKGWVKLDADWMSKSVYDSGSTGRVDNAEQLNDGTNTVTAAQARSHINDSTIHFVINDSVTAANIAWSSIKISSELGSKISTGANVGTGQGNVFRDVTGTTLNMKTLLQAGNVTITDNVNDISISTTAELNDGVNIGTGEGNVYEGKPATTLRFKTLKAGANVTITDNAADVTITAASGTTNLSNAQFPDWAGFVVQGSTAISATTNVNFSTSNKHALTGTGTTQIGALTFPQANAHYFLVIPSTIRISGVNNSGKQEYGQNDLTAGRAHVMAIYWDGTTAHWQTSEAPS